MSFANKAILLLLLESIIFYILEKHREFITRTNYLLTCKLEVEQEEVETMRGINKILLENILPAHVAQHFLARTPSLTDELYHETYVSCGVLFGSVNSKNISSHCHFI